MSSAVLNFYFLFILNSFVEPLGWFSLSSISDKYGVMCLVKKLYKLDDYCGIVICGEYPPKSPMAI